MPMFTRETIVRNEKHLLGLLAKYDNMHTSNTQSLSISLVRTFHQRDDGKFTFGVVTRFCMNDPRLSPEKNTHNYFAYA